MPQANIYFDDEESNKIKAISDEWDLSKNDTVRRIVREFKFKI